MDFSYKPAWREQNFAHTEPGMTSFSQLMESKCLTEVDGLIWL